jgi:hypothetical protein
MVLPDIKRIISDKQLITIEESVTKRTNHYHPQKSVLHYTQDGELVKGKTERAKSF